MAREWIKMRCDLDEDPAVIIISEATGLPEDHVIGKLWKVWRWANRELRSHDSDAEIESRKCHGDVTVMSRPGHARGVSKGFIDRHVNHPGFADAMVKAGWLEVHPHGITIPRFDRHNSQSAKERALATERKAAQRGRDVVTEMSRSERDKNVTREEKRIEEKRIEEKTPPNPRKRGQGQAETIHPGFLEFWNEYLKKQDKQDAIKAWNKLAPDEPLRAVIMTALRERNKTQDWQKEAHRYVPQAAKFLNRRLWEDQIPRPPDPADDLVTWALEQEAAQ